MKNFFLVIGCMFASTTAFSAQSCLSKEEGKELFNLRMALAQVKNNRPDCKFVWGGMGCLPPSDLAKMNFYEAKENGDADACLPKEEVQSSDIE